MRNLYHNLTLLLVATASSLAYAQHLDIALYRLGEGLHAGGYAFGGDPSVLPGDNVFIEEMEFLPAVRPNVALASSPGWNAPAAWELPFGAQTLPGSASVDVFGAVLPPTLSGRNLAYWSGVGSPSFGPVPDDEVLVYAATGFSVFDGSEHPVGAIEIGVTSASGGIHAHPGFSLYGEPTLVDVHDPPTAGVYLLSLQASIVGHGVSNPIYVLFGQQVDPGVLGDAADYVRLASVPEPSAVLLAALMVAVRGLKASRASKRH